MPIIPQGERGTQASGEKRTSMRIKDEAAWAEFGEKNAGDPYSKCVVDFAKDWAEAMEPHIDAGEPFSAFAEAECQRIDRGNPDYGITGFQYGCAVGMLAQVWEHGEALRQWHNLATQIHSEGERANETGGVLNPAVVELR